MIILSNYNELSVNGKEIIELSANGIQLWKKEEDQKQHTKIYYVDGTSEEKDIVGELTWQSIGKCEESEENTTIQKVEIGTNVTSIGQYAFQGCTPLTSINIPNSVISIGNGTFRSCKNLQQISCYATTAPTINSGIFGTSTSNYTGRNYYSARTNTLYVPQNATGYDVSYWADPLQNSEKCGFHIEYMS